MELSGAGVFVGVAHGAISMGERRQSVVVSYFDIGEEHEAITV